jgi:putative oxidoreductase
MRAHMHDLLSSIGLLILRLGIGGYMVTHGWGKVQMLRAGQAEMMQDPIGIGNVPTLVLLIFAEFVCALLVMIGLATRFAAAPIVIAMAVAAFVAHADDPWTMQTAAERFFAGEMAFPAAKQGALMFLIPFLALVFTSAGRFSIDAILFPDRRPGATESPAVDPHANERR